MGRGIERTKEAISRVLFLTPVTGGKVEIISLGSTLPYSSSEYPGYTDGPSAPASRPDPLIPLAPGGVFRLLRHRNSP